MDKTPTCRSREQFAKWVRQETGWGTKQRVAQLHDALTFVNANGLVDETTEYTLRPLFTLRAEGYGDHMPAVWAEAVKASNGHPTKTTTAAASESTVKHAQSQGAKLHPG